jgi:hypothetical protein
MENQIVKINAADYGLEETKAKEIESLFIPMLAKMTELEDEYNSILKEEINPETCQRAKDLRLCYIKVRTGTAEIHKKAKEFYLNGGRFVDGWKNAQLFASGEKEKTLKAIEDHFENQERERCERLRIERTNLLKPYSEIEPLELGSMEQAVFDNYLAGVKLAYETKIAAEKKAEEDAIENKKKDDLYTKRTSFIAGKKSSWFTQFKTDLVVSFTKETTEDEWNKIISDIEIKEKELLDQVIKDAQIKKVQDDKDAEDKRKKDEEKKAKRAPDKDKLLAFMQLINDLPRPEVKSIEAADIASKANIMLVQAANYIKDSAKKL